MNHSSLTETRKDELSLEELDNIAGGVTWWAEVLSEAAHTGKAVYVDGRYIDTEGFLGLYP